MANLERRNQALRDAREAASLTREDLAQRADTSTSTIARMELGGHIPSAMTLSRIASVLDVPLESLLTPTAPALDASYPQASRVGATSVSGAHRDD